MYFIVDTLLDVIAMQYLGLYTHYICSYYIPRIIYYNNHACNIFNILYILHCQHHQQLLYVFSHFLLFTFYYQKFFFFFFVKLSSHCSREHKILDQSRKSHVYLYSQNYVSMGFTGSQQLHFQNQTKLATKVNGIYRNKNKIVTATRTQKVAGWSRRFTHTFAKCLRLTHFFHYFPSVSPATLFWLCEIS